MNKIGAIGLSILGVTIVGGVVLRGIGCFSELACDIAEGHKRKKLEKLSKDPNSNIIKIGNEYYEVSDVQNSEESKG